MRIKLSPFSHQIRNVFVKRDDIRGLKELFSPVNLSQAPEFIRTKDNLSRLQARPTRAYISSFKAMVWLIACCLMLEPMASLAGTADRNANATTKAVYSYLVRLKKRTKNKVLSGQHLGHGDSILKGKTDDGYTKYVEELHRQTGKYVALVGADYGLTNSTNFSEWNKVLIDHWKNKGLVELSWHFSNPWTGGNSWDLREANLNHLLSPGMPGYYAWRTQLARIGDALQDLEDAGVTVLFRPLHEMNGNWFYWGMTAHPNDPEPFKALWRDMFNYLTKTRGLHNLIWVYSVTGFGHESWTKPLDFYYPGSQYVDVVGADVYDDEALMRNSTDYDKLRALGKPIAFSEFGPNNVKDGSWDNAKLIERIKTKYPDIVYWINWHDWQENGATVAKSMVRNRNASQLLWDPWVITRDKVRW